MNRKARRKPLQEAFARDVDLLAKQKSDAWLRRNPPRLDVPTSWGTWRESLGEGTYEVEFSQTPRPTSPVWYVPIMREPRMARLMVGGYSERSLMVEEFPMRAVAFGMSLGATRLRWWNWEPVRPEGTAESTAYRAANGAHTMMARLSPVVKLIAKLDPYGYQWGSGMTGDMLLEWWGETIDLLGQWLGFARTKYVIPGESGAPEERVTEARR